MNLIKEFVQGLPETDNVFVNMVKDNVTDRKSIEAFLGTSPRAANFTESELEAMSLKDLQSHITMRLREEDEDILIYLLATHSPMLGFALTIDIVENAINQEEAMHTMYNPWQVVRDYITSVYNQGKDEDKEEAARLVLDVTAGTISDLTLLMFPGTRMGTHAHNGIFHYVPTANKVEMLSAIDESGEDSQELINMHSNTMTDYVKYVLTYLTEQVDTEYEMERPLLKKTLMLSHDILDNFTLGIIDIDTVDSYLVDKMLDISLLVSSFPPTDLGTLILVEANETNTPIMTGPLSVSYAISKLTDIMYEDTLDIELADIMANLHTYICKGVDIINEQQLIQPDTLSHKSFNEGCNKYLEVIQSAFDEDTYSVRDGVVMKIATDAANMYFTNIMYAEAIEESMKKEQK